MKKIFTLLVLMLSTMIAGAANSAIDLEGSFKLGPAILLIIILVLFILVGIVFRAKDTTDFYAAGRKISRVGSGMAIASNWMSAASFLGMAALMYGLGYHGLSYVVGWTGGYVLLLILMAGQIRKYGKFTAADFIGDRYYSRNLRAVGAIIAILISIAYCVGQFGGIGLMFKWILGMPYWMSVVIGGAVVLSYTLLSGMLGVTKNMQIQYVVIIISFLIPLFILMFKFDYFWVVPQIGYGSVVSDVVNGIPMAEASALINKYGHQFSSVAMPEYAMPWDTAYDTTFFQWIAISFSLMIGTAGLPHVLQRFYVVPKVSDARWSVVWGLFFICILYWSAPVYSALGRILSAHPEIGYLEKDAIVVYTAQLGNIHPLVVGLLAAGGVSAAFSTVSGLLVAGSSAFAHDLYVRVFYPDSSPKVRLRMARWATVVMAVIVASIALLKLALIGQLVAVAFSLAGCTIFPLFLLGIWWSGSNKQGAIGGLIAGGLVSAIAIAYFIAGKMGWIWPFHEFVDYYLGAWYFAVFGAPLAIITHIIVARLTPETPLHIRKFLIENVHTS
ncbi:MAG: VC_2705 family sodium/solute symporter [Bacteroidales bacterium]